VALRVRTNFTGVAGAPYYNNLYFADESTAQGCLDAAEAFWNDMSELMVTGCTWGQEDEVAYIDTSDGHIIDFLTGVGATGAGDSASEMLPPADQVLVHWRTNLIVSGRRLQGSTFVPAISQNFNDEGQLLASAVTVAGTAAQNLIDSTDANFAIWSRTHGALSPAVSAAIFTGFGVLRSRRD